MQPSSSATVAVFPASIASIEAHANKALRLIILSFLIILGAAGFLVWRWSGEEAAQHLEAIRLSEAQVVEGRAASVADWAKRQSAHVNAMAANPSLLPYLIGGASSSSAGLLGYARTYLREAAEKGGFLLGASTTPANTQRPEGPGVAVLDQSGHILLAVGGPLTPADDLIAMSGSGLRVDGHSKLSAGSVVRFLKPIEGARERFYIYAVRLLDEDLKQRLVQPGESYGTAEYSLIAPGSLGPVAVIGRTGVAAGESLAEDSLSQAALAAQPQTVMAQDSSGRSFLVSARAIPGIQWTLLRIRPAHKLLAEVQIQRWLTLGVCMLGLSLVGALALLAWRYGLSARVAQVAAREEALRLFIQRIADRQPTGIYVVGPQGTLRFANHTAHAWNSVISTPQGETIASLGDGTSAVDEAIMAVRSGKGPYKTLLSDQGRRLQLEAYALDPHAPRGDVLLVVEDVTEVLRERERREASLEALVSTLTGLIDSRDPDSRGHSQRVAQIAASVARVFSYDALMVRTLKTAGQLMNLGKIFVSSRLLTRSAPLTSDEKAQVREAMAQSAQILEQIPFDGPVARIIGEIDAPHPPQEARILKLVNAFVGMTSPRAHRAALSVSAALAALSSQGDEADQAILTALRFSLEKSDSGNVIEQNEPLD